MRNASAIVSIRFPPTRSTKAPAIGPAMRLTAAFVPSDEACGTEVDPALVVQIDEREREHEPVPECVQEPAELQVWIDRGSCGLRLRR